MAWLLIIAAVLGQNGPTLQWIRIAADGAHFIEAESGRKFVPWGFNYDHDETGRLIEDYWDDEWPTIKADFREMKQLGANVVRVHLQFGKFMQAADQPNPHSLKQLSRLVMLAEQTGLYLDLTGLGCYHKQDVPCWYDALDRQQRWQAQARFWEAVAERCADSPAIFCYDLMNEPVVPGGNKKRNDWLGPGFAGKHFVQFIALETEGQPRPKIAKAWVDRLVAAVRKHDRKHLVTVGMVPWSLDRPGLNSGFVPGEVADNLDFIAVHVYPQRGENAQALEIVRGFNIGKPVVVEETFPLKCPREQLSRFIVDSREQVQGWISFYWGRTIAECRRQNTLADAIKADWLETFSTLKPKTE